MYFDSSKRTTRSDFLMAAALVTTGLVISGLSLIELNARPPQQMAQATQPLQQAPAEEKKPPVPAETTTGTRPPSVPPEPARPDPEAQKSGARPALPPAPAEKQAPPIKEK